MARSLYRSLTERLLDAARPPAAVPGALLRLGLRPRAVGATRPRRSASSAATTGRCSSTPRTRSSTALVTDIPPAPPQQAEIVAANRSGRPLVEHELTVARGPARAARERSPQFSLLVAVNAFVGAMVGLERSTLPLIGEDDFGLASSAAVLSFIVAFGLAKALHQPRRRRAAPSASAGGGC